MNKRLRNSNIETLQKKEQLRNVVKEKTRNSFLMLEETLGQLVASYNEQLDPQGRLQLQKRSDRILQLTVNTDTLIFVLQTGVFQFDRDHAAMTTEYVTEDPERAYVGIISIYDFLTDSFTFERDEDEGYMVARVFVNKESTFFVEGKRQRNMGHKSYGKNRLDSENWTKIVETAIKYSTEMEALVPPYETHMLTNMAAMNLEIMQSKSKNGKRLGFRFRSDDVDE